MKIKIDQKEVDELFSMSWEDFYSKYKLNYETLNSLSFLSDLYCWMEKRLNKDIAYDHNLFLIMNDNRKLSNRKIFEDKI